jgi:SET domain-containing protein
MSSLTSDVAGDSLEPTLSVDTNDSSVNEEVVLQTYYRIGLGEKGRGLFATHDIPPSTLLHIAPCILVTTEEYESHIKYTVLEHYLFNCQGGNKLLALGDGSLFNHTRRPNVDYRVDVANLKIRYLSGHRPIQRGEELCISYGTNLWFDDADGNESSSSDDEEPNQDRLTGFLSNLQFDETG